MIIGLDRTYQFIFSFLNLFVYSVW